MHAGAAKNTNAEDDGNLSANARPHPVGQAVPDGPSEVVGNSDARTLQRTERRVGNGVRQPCSMSGTD